MAHETFRDAAEKALFDELIRGAREAFANAEQLYREACLLRDNGALSRALFLHQISLEECAKVELLGGWVTSLLTGTPVDLAKLTAAMASHKAKNRLNAYMQKPEEAELAARARGDLKGAVEAFKGKQAAFHDKSNTAKNAALYVDFIDGKFTTPDERITAAMATEVADTNHTYLGLMYHKVDMFTRWQANPDEIRGVLGRLTERMEALKAQHPNAPEAALEIALQDMLDDVRQRPGTKDSVRTTDKSGA